MKEREERAIPERSKVFPILAKYYNFRLIPFSREYDAVRAAGIKSEARARATPFSRKRHPFVRPLIIQRVIPSREWTILDFKIEHVRIIAAYRTLMFTRDVNFLYCY